MTLTLTLREQPVVPLEADVLCPDRLAGAGREEIEALPVWHGNERTRVGEFFAVSGAGDDVRLEGDLRRMKFVGAGMTAGRLTVAGDVGMHAGAGMRGGELLVEGDAGDWAGAGMRGGRLVVRGSAGRQLGGVYAGERAGMRGGEIVVGGDAAGQAGAGLRRGLIAVTGRAGDAAGLRMLAGTIVALGGLGPRAGAGMRRGSIVTMAPATPLPTFVYSCIYRPPFLRLYLRRLRALGLPVSDEQLAGRYARWCGDGLELRRGEILILEDGLERPEADRRHQIAGPDAPRR
jgi:formylmethanofuran dehydrogenase subunit C